jgi:hypothetical protein
LFLACPFIIKRTRGSAHPTSTLEHINTYLYKVITFTATIQKFGRKGEKTGWSYLEVSAEQAQRLKPGCRVPFRVKGSIDNHEIAGVTLMPMGEGNFILPFNAAMRKATGKSAGATVRVRLAADEKEYKLNKDLMACLRADPDAHEFFKTLPGAHQRYFSKWIDAAKTSATRTKRLVMAVEALSRRMGFGEMIRANKQR